MTRVSLKEAYDNKDVIAQIYAIRDTAESAVDTSEQAVTTANTASEHVDALVPQVEGAVENANQASASAQASAQTVAGYDGRLTVAEGAIDELESDVNAVTLRVTTAEGDIVTIQGRVTALETADGQNVKIDRINDYAVGLTGNQTAVGIKQGNFYTFAGGIEAIGNPDTYTDLGSLGPVGGNVAIALSVVSRANVAIGAIYIDSQGVGTFSGQNGANGAVGVYLGVIDNNMHLLVRRESTAGQNISINIFGVTKTNQRIDLPPGGLGSVVCTNAVRIVLA